MSFLPGAQSQPKLHRHPLTFYSHLSHFLSTSPCGPLLPSAVHAARKPSCLSPPLQPPLPLHTDTSTPFSQAGPNCMPLCFSELCLWVQPLLGGGTCPAPLLPAQPLRNMDSPPASFLPPSPVHSTQHGPSRIECHRQARVSWTRTSQRWKLWGRQAMGQAFERKPWPGHMWWAGRAEPRPWVKKNQTSPWTPGTRGETRGLGRPAAATRQALKVGHSAEQPYPHRTLPLCLAAGGL